MNTNTNNYFSKTDNESLKNLFDSFPPKDSTVWFLEKRDTEEWLKSDHTLTKHPNKCMHFTSAIKAWLYLQEHKLDTIYEPTEHMFIEDKH